MAARPILQVVTNGTGARSARHEVTESEASLAAAYGGLRRALAHPLPPDVRVALGCLCAQLENQIIELNSLRHRLPSVEELGGCPHNIGSTADACPRCSSEVRHG